MKLFRYFALLSCICLALPSFAAGKIAVVDFQKAILTTDLAKSRIAKLESEAAYKDNIEKIKALSQDAQALFKKYQKEEPLMSVEQKTEMQGQLKSMQSDIQHLEGKLQEQNKQALAPLVLQMQAAAQRVVDAIRQEDGYGLVLVANPQVVFYADTSFDITAKVTDQLNKLASAKK
ncbi:MAG: OmpH family outer membrane protein [Pseudomonadales bacterium]|nr:OmpH family outer membrane protein [Pseudomonadales bacterium]